MFAILMFAARLSGGVMGLLAGVVALVIGVARLTANEYGCVVFRTYFPVGGVLLDVQTGAQFGEQSITGSKRPGGQWGLTFDEHYAIQTHDIPASGQSLPGRITPAPLELMDLVVRPFYGTGRTFLARNIPNSKFSVLGSRDSSHVAYVWEDAEGTAWVGVSRLDGAMIRQTVDKGGYIYAPPPTLLAFSPDGRYLMTQASEGALQTVTFWRLDWAQGTLTPSIVVRFPFDTSLYEMDQDDWLPPYSGSPSGSWMILTEIDPHNGSSLILVNPDTNQRLRLPLGEMPLLSTWGWSPDGRHATIVTAPSGRGGAEFLHIIGPSGFVKRGLPKAPGSDVLWSPDGETVVFFQTGESPNTLVRADYAVRTGEVRRWRSFKVGAGRVRALTHRWVCVPEGDTLRLIDTQSETPELRVRAYVNNECVPPVLPAPDGRVWLVPGLGGQPAATTGAADATGGSSPAAVARAEWLWVRLDAPQSGALALPGDFTVIEASWSADGRWLAYSAMSPLGSAAANDAALYLVDTQDWTTRLLIEDVQPVLRLSPDARWVYAQRVRGTDKISLLISTDSTQAIESTPSYLWSGYSDSPRWSPDSRALVFTHQANNRLVVDVIGIDAQLKRRFENPMFIMGTLPVDEAWTHCEATPPTP